MTSLFSVCFFKFLKKHMRQFWEDKTWIGFVFWMDCSKGLQSSTFHPQTQNSPLLDFILFILPQNHVTHRPLKTSNFLLKGPSIRTLAISRGSNQSHNLTRKNFQAQTMKDLNLGQLQRGWRIVATRRNQLPWNCKTAVVDFFGKGGSPPDLIGDINSWIL